MFANRSYLTATVALTLALFAGQSPAHHSVLNYDGKSEVKISGIVTRARFGFPHSIYRIDVTNEDGSVEEWILSTEDPRDAERLGFADELKSIKAGDPITVIGWPDKFKKREIRGHQLLYPDGTVVMMRRGNYIWPKDILRLDKFVMNPQNINEYINDVDATLPIAEQVILWIDEDDHIARAAFEVSEERARLIGLQSGGSSTYLGVAELLECHTQRNDFTMTISIDDLSPNQRNTLEENDEYVSEYNRVLSRWWEQERESCE
jgi:hypothetical protein